MRIASLELRAFGCFTDKALGFGYAQPDFHLVYGPNEAGKTTALRALSALLFGIAENTVDAYRHPPNQLRVAGSLEAPDGERLELVRRKGRKQTLSDPTGNPIDERRVSQLVADIGEQTFRSAFAISREGLIAGGEALLDQRGDIGRSLFGAGLGTQTLTGVLDGLENQARSLFKPSGKNPAINASLREYSHRRRQARELSLSSQSWHELNGRLEDARGQRAELADRISGAEKRLSGLRRLQSVLGLVAKRHTVRIALEELSDVVVLADTASDDRVAAVAALEAARKESDRARRRIEELERQIQGLEVPAEVVGFEQRISQLYARLSQQGEKQRRLSGLEAQLVQSQRQARALCERIAPKLTLDEARRLQPTAAREAQIQDLAGRYPHISSEVKTRRERLEQTQGELRNRRAQLAGQSRPANTDALEAALTRAQRAGDLETELAAASSELADLRASLKRELEAFVLWEGTLEELRRAPVPLQSTVEGFRKAFSELDTELGSLDAQLAQLEQQIGECDQKLTELELTRDLPAYSELAAARERRQSGWALVLASWQSGASPRAPHPDYDPERPLQDAYEQSVAWADELSDRLRLAADELARRASLTAQRHRLAQQADHLRTKRGDRGKRRAELTESWRDIWRPAALEPLAPDEMRDWLDRRARICDCAQACDRKSARVDELTRALEHHKRCLDACLLEIAEDELPAPRTLESTLERAAAVVADVKARTNTHDQLTDDCQKLEARAQSDRAALESAEQDLAAWRSDWAAAVQAIGGDAETTPAQATAICSTLAALSSKLETVDGLRAQIDATTRDSEDFAMQVAWVAEHIDAELAGVDPSEAVKDLHRRLSQAQTNRAKLSQADEQLHTEREALAVSEQEHAEAKAQLDSLLAQAGCETVEELERTEQTSARKKALADELRGLDSQIAERGAESVESLVKKADDTDPDALAAAIDSAERELSELDQARSQLDQTIGRHSGELERMDGSQAATEAFEQAEAELARLGELSERYVRARLAHTVLSRAIDRYREKNQSALIASAGRLFATLTRGSFTGLSASYEHGAEPVLVGRRGADEQVELEAMSDGTRDQLYLALRLASLDRYYEQNEPLPLVLDDVLLNFDDDRARAGFEALLELATKTQVIFFTHHRHLVELAGEVTAGHLSLQEL